MTHSEKFAAGSGILEVTSDYGGKLDDLHFKSVIKYSPSSTGTRLKPDYLKEIVDSSIGESEKSSIRVTSSDPNTVILEQIGSFPREGHGASKYIVQNDYRLSSITTETVAELQSVLSKKDYSIRVNNQGHEDHVYCDARIAHKKITLRINTRRHDYDHRKSLEDATIGLGNDEEKKPMALAIIDQMLPKLRKELDDKPDSYGRNVSTIRNLSIDSTSGGSIKLNVEFWSNEEGNRLLAEMQKDLERLSEQGLTITGNRAEQIAAKKPSMDLDALSRAIEDKVVAALGATPTSMRLAADIKEIIYQAHGQELRKK